MTTAAKSLSEEEVRQYLASLEEANLAPLWMLNTMSREPRTPVQPYQWRWADVYSLLVRAGDVMSPAPEQGEGPAERRVLLLNNPGMKQYNATSNTLVTGFQLIFPGEIAPAHRHTACATRLMLRGLGAYTTVEGEKIEMFPGDLILTPPWRWHNHGNTGNEPIVWMDGLDRLLTQQLNALFMDPFPGGVQEVSKPADYSVKTYGATNVRPSWEDIPTSSEISPQMVYRWTATKAVLDEMAAAGQRGPSNEISVHYVNPVTKAYAVPTLGLGVQLLPAGDRTRARRHTGSRLYHVLEGKGSTVINGTRFDWEKGDSIVVPPWSWYEHANTGSGAAYLFIQEDLPTLRALGLYREQIAPANG